MSITNSIRAQIPPIHPEGYPFIGGFALARSDSVLDLDAAWLDRHVADSLVRAVFPRSGAGHARCARALSWRRPTGASPW